MEILWKFSKIFPENCATMCNYRNITVVNDPLNPLPEFPLFDDLSNHLNDMSAGIAKAREKISNISATASELHGAVKVTIGPDGNLASVSLTPDAYKTPPQALGTAIKKAYDKANLMIIKQARSALSEIIGDEQATILTQGYWNASAKDISSDKLPTEVSPISPSKQDDTDDPEIPEDIFNSTHNQQEIKNTISYDCEEIDNDRNGKNTHNLFE